jgi:O-antigen/teichoic acid export membrane protein
MQAVAGIGFVFACTGFRNVITRQVARSPEMVSRLLQAALWFRVCAGLVAAIGIGAYSLISTAGFPQPLAAAAIALMAGQLAWDFLESAAFGRQDMKGSAVINAVGSAVWAAAVWLAPKTWITPLTVSWSFAALQLLKAAPYVRASRVGSLLTETACAGPDNLGGRALLRESFPFFLVSVLTAATSQLPVLFLAERSGEREVGLFNAGYRLTAPITMLISTVLTALYPRLAQSSAHDRGGFTRQARRAFLWLTGAVAGAAVVATLFSAETVGLLYGYAYQDSAAALTFQCWFLVPYAALCMIGTTLAACDRQNCLASLSAACAAISTPILWYGAGHGATGLAQAMMIAAAVNLTYHWIVFVRAVTEPKPMRQLLLGVAIAAGLGLSFAVSSSCSWSTRLVICAALLCGLGILGCNEWRKLRRA